ncbi:DUF5807 family protein [Halalkalicoccus jeotgali]|uniref:Uncharacterized protein n=1 Tax=Halalkalicoccus jeotgali (strain DSM 18796 / CECT 7217 / JCM 14584 / KCTC 4019 / B3) TaxID=795797 RepID=D8J991_HALJB|nr:DUF5807 family protein [Halalkalicoccus jeotgali]ADJ16360.1 hypothetical protein HacjB3_14905 [Halalkalicoccus jeotgali B3]ELY37094.1 hypothetical protein C497_10133 [Halalkalicoccus jeotgali B3]
MSRLAEFLAGERPEDVAIYLDERVVDDLGKLADYGEETEDGIVLVVPGESGRNAFSTVAGTDAMAFAKEAMDEEGDIDADLAGGICPACDAEDVRYVFAFAEERNEEVGGIYAEGDVIHAYARCGCSSAFSDRWVAGER